MNDKTFDWIGSGPSGIALGEQLLGLLVAKGVISPAERLQVIDGAIASLSQGGDTKSSADNLRIIFKRP